MDAVDISEKYEAEARERRIEAIRGELSGKGSSHCVECGDEIPAKRREIIPNCTLCVDCADYLARKRV